MVGPVSSAALVAALVAGMLLVSYGAWLAYAPAGFVTAGVLLCATVIAYVRGGRTDE